MCAMHSAQRALECSRARAHAAHPRAIRSTHREAGHDLASPGTDHVHGRATRRRRRRFCDQRLGERCVRAAANPALKEFTTPYALIDADPHVRRVINYFRPSDYTAWAGTAAAFPGLLYLLGRLHALTRKNRRDAAALRVGNRAAFVGVSGRCRRVPPCISALYLYVLSTYAVRFWGWTENEREQAHAQAEVAAGKAPGFGTSSLSDEMQGAAFRNSVFSQLNFAVMPWFNFVNHNYHEPTAKAE